MFCCCAPAVGKEELELKSPRYLQTQVCVTSGSDMISNISIKGPVGRIKSHLVVADFNREPVFSLFNSKRNRTILSFM